MGLCTQRSFKGGDGVRPRGLPIFAAKDHPEPAWWLPGTWLPFSWSPHLRRTAGPILYSPLVPNQKPRAWGPIMKACLIHFVQFALLLAAFLAGMLWWHRHSMADFGRDWPEVWGSCLNPPLQYWWKTLRNPKRVEECNELVLQAAARGRAAQLRGIEIGLGKREVPPLDGCSLANGGRNGSFGLEAWEAPGGSRWRWGKRDGPPLGKACRLEWVTYSTECGANLNRIADICDLMGIQLRIVGLRDWWMGWGGRTRMIREVIQSLPSDRLVLSSDADDVLLLPTPACTPARIIETFASVRRPILFGAERYCYPDGEKWNQYPAPPRDTPYRYINGGTSLGFAWAMMDIIGQAYRGDCIDDQREFTRVYLDQTAYVGKPDIEGHREIVDRWIGTLDHPGERHLYVQLDWYNLLLLPLGGAELSEFDFSGYGRNGTIRSKLTEGRPCFFHQNGDKKERPHNPVVWPHLLRETGIDELREKEGYMRKKRKP